MHVAELSPTEKHATLSGTIEGMSATHAQVRRQESDARTKAVLCNRVAGAHALAC